MTGNLFNQRWFVAFRQVRRRGLEIRIVGWLAEQDVLTAVDVCAGEGLEGLVEFDAEVPLRELAQLVRAGRQMMSHPRARRLWVVEREPEPEAA